MKTNNTYFEDDSRVELFDYILAERVDHTWPIIRCDFQEILNNPHHHIDHERFVNKSICVRLWNELFFYSLFMLNHRESQQYIEHRHCQSIKSKQ